MAPPFEIQGHRGAHGLAPENTLAAFEIALDAGVTSIETDVHLTRDDVPILHHDENIGKSLLRTLTLKRVRALRIAGPTHAPTPVAVQLGIHPHGVPTLAELFTFTAAYAGAPGRTAGKTDAQRAAAARVIFDIELKRRPYTPETIGDDFDGKAPALLERLVVAAITEADALARSRVRSFDHRSVRAVRQLAPDLPTAILVHETAPADIGQMMDAAGADFFCPDYRFVDPEIIRQVHLVGKRIIPYTVNAPADWARLYAWGIDGVTTDDPHHLRRWLRTQQARHGSRRGKSSKKSSD